MGPANGIIGQDFPTDIPETQLNDEVSRQLQQTARFSKTKEWKQLKEHLENRIKFYQTYLPDGRAIGAQNPSDIGQNWVAANVIIGEFTALIETYEQAAQATKER